MIVHNYFLNKLHKLPFQKKKTYMQLDGGGAVKMGFEARVFVSENEQMVEGDRILGQIFVRWHVWKKKTTSFSHSN